MKLRVSFDPVKNARNIEERGLSFAEAAEFDWSTAHIAEDTRHDYPERRYQALGFVNQHLHMLVFTPREEAIHIISFRRANGRERNHYAKQTQS